MIRLVLIIVSVFSLSEFILAQNVTTTAVPFLLIAPDSRSSGYGEGGVAMAGVDPNTIFWNPAALHKIKSFEVAITHSNWLPQFQTDLFYDYLAVAYPLDDDLGTLGMHFTFLNLGENYWTSPEGQDLGKFKSYDFALGTSYGVALDEEWSFGTGLRLIYSRLAPNFVQVGNEPGGNGSSFNIAFDLATEYQPIYFDKLLRVGASITNIGPKMAYVDDKQADPMPTKFRLGTSYRIIDDEYYTTDLYVEMSKLLVVSDEIDTVANTEKRYSWYEGLYKSWYKDGVVNELTKSNLSIGGEFTYEKYVSLRMGYFYENKSYGGRQFITYGAGIVYDFLKVDFSYISTFEENHPLAGTIRISLGCDITMMMQ